MVPYVTLRLSYDLKIRPKQHVRSTPSRDPSRSSSKFNFQTSKCSQCISRQPSTLSQNPQRTFQSSFYATNRPADSSFGLSTTRYDLILISYHSSRFDNYQDLVRVASEKLALEPNAVPLFHTSTLDICRGHSVEVDESAYQAMCTALDELTVITDSAVVEQDQEHRG